jgi:outer membrane biosynthesis protein TonB
MMNARTLILAGLMGLAALGLSGCPHNTVRATPPKTVSASTRTIEPMPQPVPSEKPETANEPAPEPSPSSAPVPRAPLSAPAPPRPAPVETPKPKPEPEPPQISPQLSPQDQADAMRHTNDDIRTAERNLQRANGRKLNDSQTDLVGKVQGFLSQAHEAILANDWVRARNLALKAEVLSTELVKSL